MDFTLESALLYISKTKPESKEDFENMKRAQDVVKNSDKSAKQIKEIRTKVLSEDKADKKIIKYQQMKPKQKDMVDNMGKMGIGMKNNKGGAILKKNVEKMSYGGMSGGKKHMYSAGGDVIDNLPNKGTKQLAKTKKGRDALKNMGFNV